LADELVVITTTALALPEPLVKPLFAESRNTQETTMQSRSTKKSAVVVLCHCEERSDEAISW